MQTDRRTVKNKLMHTLCAGRKGKSLKATRNTDHMQTERKTLKNKLMHRLCTDRKGETLKDRGHTQTGRQSNSKTRSAEIIHKQEIELTKTKKGQELRSRTVRKRE
jgi:hypothetical protein